MNMMIKSKVRQKVVWPVRAGPVCENSESNSHYWIANGRVWKCKLCGGVSWFPNSFYEWQEYSMLEREKGKEAAWKAWMRKNRKLKEDMIASGADTIG
jgi:hypothetical protein